MTVMSSACAELITFFIYEIRVDLLFILRIMIK